MRAPRILYDDDGRCPKFYRLQRRSRRYRRPAGSRPPPFAASMHWWLLPIGRSAGASWNLIRTDRIGRLTDKPWSSVLLLIWP